MPRPRNRRAYPTDMVASLACPLSTARAAPHEYTLWLRPWSLSNLRTALTSLSRRHNYGHIIGRPQTCSTLRPCTTAFLSLPTNPAGTTLYPGPPDRPPDGAYRPGYTPAGDPTHCTARRRRALATVSPDRPRHFRPPCGEFGTRRRLHSSTDTEPWIRRLLPQFEDVPRRL